MKMHFAVIRGGQICRQRRCHGMRFVHCFPSAFMAGRLTMNLTRYNVHACLLITFGQMYAL